MVDEVNYKVVIVGGGSAGISVAARLAKGAPDLKGKILIVDPAKKHYYQPLWTLAGAGAVKKEVTVRDQQSLIPVGVELLQEAVTSIDADSNSLTTGNGTEIHYDFLVMAAGIQIDWDKIKGLKEAIGKDGVCSNYSYDYVDSTWESIQNFKGGNAIFTHPNTPIKCGGAPQKIMYLADDAFRKAGVRDKSQIIFASASDSVFAVKKYANTLEQVIARKGITTKYKMNLIEVDSANKLAVFENSGTGETEKIPYSMLHVVPPMSAPDFIAQSKLADAGGWVDVDSKTLQSKKYSNVFGVGDCANLPTSKTGAAIRKQAPVAAGNLLSYMKNQSLKLSYDGYTSCPLITGYNKLVLAEFLYENKPAETFPFDQSKERYSMYILKKNILPVMYWKGMLKGIM
ncbi:MULTISPECIES: FAD/NAD(P)-binding oxidoreductase [unclassified Mesobacillus]|uniref:NAD(P)/FAD-dependent oxidoreductase n=1 Tax=unclassified Mesobacillus TaxID=2675270 RepID=UPI00203B778F|nr:MULTISPECIES: FAD/NAD(P)-binding oxidoreductase [unclassified Mesobacillus]MCM3123028.1 NAD(P)/FAD-dependent oxidoreductase [Mesobacillus sp. MER 33]MCM3233489.1 NAD(P)/FAD-dependent oxidoreductase [Mesobacillus sp. MER 48]